MIQKLEKLLDVAIETLVEARNHYARLNGVAELPFKEAKEAKEAAPAAAATRIDTAEKPARRGRPKKVEVKPAAAETAAEETSPFTSLAAVEKPAAVEPKLSVEDAIEAARRGQEVMGVFIRRYLRAKPTGLERAKGFIEQQLGAPRNGESTWKLEHFTPADWLKLTPVFERELEAADAK